MSVGKCILERKKRISVFLFVWLCIVLSACADSGKEQNISNQHIQYSQRLIEIADQYMDYEITAEEARDELEKLEERSAEITRAEPGTDDYFAASTIQNCFWNIELAVNRLEFSASQESMKDILQQRNKLAELIGEQIRKK